MMLKIRPIEYKEIEEVSKIVLKFFNEPNVSDGSILPIEINRKFWLEFVSKVLAENRISLIVAEVDGKIVGYAMFNPAPFFPFKVKEKWFYITDIYILPEYRKKGIGKALINYIINLAKSQEIKKIKLSVWTFNRNAINFYEKLGFKITGYLMEKDLD